MNYEKLSPAEQICEIMTRIYDARLTTVSGGNISVKDDEGNLWITPSGGDKGRYDLEDILCIKPDGEAIGARKPSVETEIHKAILKSRPEFKAVVHAHPPALVAMSFLRELPQLRLIPQVAGEVKEPRLAKYACPGTDELKDMVEKEFVEGKKTNTAILENHGAFVASEKGLKAAFGLFQDLDYSIQLQAKAHTYAEGKINTITDEQLAEYNEATAHAYEGLEIERAISPFESELEEVEPEAAIIYYFGEDEEKEMRLRDEICDFMYRGYGRGLFTQNIGVISARIDEDSFLITQSGSDNALLTAEQIVKVTGNQVEIWESGKSDDVNKQNDSEDVVHKLPSKSVLLHKKIYEENPDVNAIIMGAPANAMVFAITDYNYDLKTIPECYIVLREDISKFPFGATYKQQAELAKYFKEKAPVAIVENDCFICTGSSVYNAFDKLEVLEFSAEAVVNAKLLGGNVKTITEEQAQEIKNRFK